MQAAPYGSWKSAISAEQLAAATVRFGQIKIAGDTVFLPQDAQDALMVAPGDNVICVRI